ncbi:alginate lyase family protein [Novosphingopyxis baekryungensis]|uniref:alginate lyase family protein n=1 Tax=Novosphingopyxis baekryungensis TaxID=279369 RepID=UPI0003B68E7E|nr:alginate lyase family protein [Novosphingopyxis baekryungensis]
MWRVEILVAIVLASMAGAAAAKDTPAVPPFEPVSTAPVCRAEQGYAADFGGRRTFLWRPRWLKGIAADPAMAAKALAAADAALKRGPYAVTDKPHPVPGAGPHDYASIGPYWWPDPDKRDGLPYLRRDGRVNPERDGKEFDKARLRALSEDMRALALGYEVSSDQRYAEHAATLVRAWFLNPATRMNPQFDFAQGIPGKVKGRGEGIIEASHLSTIVEALGLLRPSGALDTAERKALREWYGAFTVWMATSKIGEEEMRKTNNHGIFYDFYLAHFALFAGAPDAARNVIQAFPAYRLAPQMDKQGRFLAELKRTKSWHYSHFVVDGAARLATIGECVGLDLWDAQLADGRSLTTAHRFLQRYSQTPETWPFPDIDLAKGNVKSMSGEARMVALYFEPDGVPTAIGEMP